MKVTVEVRTSSRINLLNQKDPTIPIKKPTVGPPPANLTKLTPILTGVLSNPFSKLKNT